MYTSPELVTCINSCTLMVYINYRLIMAKHNIVVKLISL